MPDRWCLRALISKKSGESFPVEINSNLVYQAGKPYILSVVRDITERKQAEEALEISHERFLTVLDSIDATIYVADMDSYEILFMNNFMMEAFGRDMTGEICWEVFRGLSGPCSHCTNDQLLGPDGKPTGVCVWQDKNPITGRWYVNYDRAIEWTDGRMVKLQIATDISDFKTMEEDLRQAQKMEALGTLASGIAHDFNNILGIISGYSELTALTLPPDDKALGYIEAIIQASARAKSLVRQILTFSRKTETEMMYLDLNQCVQEAAKLIERIIPKMVDIKLDLEAELWPVSADSHQMEQLLLNMGSNAAAAMPDGGRLSITTRSVSLIDEPCQICGKLFSGDYVKLEVADNGTGIPEDVLKRIFDPFFTTKEIGKGTGLGLAMVYGIVTGHNGHINCDSTYGKGTIFTTYLPAIKTANAEDPSGSSSNMSAMTGNETVLLVDDEESLLDMVSKMLSRSGYHILTAGNGETALEIYRHNEDGIDLVVLDLGMPGMGGANCLKQIKAINPQARVLVCSGYIQHELSGEMEALGASGFLAKPYRMSDLLKNIRELLD
jgi:two-component system cell cycle sensor histidine kinase/response regulator CckA